MFLYDVYFCAQSYFNVDFNVDYKMSWFWNRFDSDTGTQTASNDMFETPLPFIPETPSPRQTRRRTITPDHGVEIILLSGS